MHGSEIESAAKAAALRVSPKTFSRILLWPLSVMAALQTSAKTAGNSRTQDLKILLNPLMKQRGKQLLWPKGEPLMTRRVAARAALLTVGRPGSDRSIRLSLETQRIDPSVSSTPFLEANQRRSYRLNRLNR